MGGLHHLEESSVPPADLLCDVVVTSLLRARAHRAPVAIRAHQLQGDLEASKSGTRCAW